MKSIIVGMVAAASLMVAGSAVAGDAPGFFKGKCFACHSMDNKVVGPAFKDVAAKYKGDADAVKKLTANIAAGGKFGWNLGTMPPKGMGASDDEVKQAAEFIAGIH